MLNIEEVTSEMIASKTSQTYYTLKKSLVKINTF